MLQTYIINSVNDFYKYFHLLKKDASVGSTPDVFVVGFDAEFISEANHPESFAKAESWVVNPNKTSVCLIQLASDNICLVINLCKMQHPIPDMLFKTIKSDSWIKLGVGIENDLSIISQNYNLGHCGGGVEIKNLALMAKYPDPSLESLYNQLTFSNSIKKKSSVCDWSKDLTKDQLTYAAKDAIVSYNLGKLVISPSVEVLESATYRKLENNISIDFVNPVLQSSNSSNSSSSNYIGKLYEYCEKYKLTKVSYTEVKSNIPQTFTFKCTLIGDCGEYTETATMNSKKEAKRESAKLVLEALNIFDDLNKLDNSIKPEPQVDYVSRLNEYTQSKSSLSAPQYYEIEPVISNPPKFRITCCIERIDQITMYKATGEGYTKREAKNNAAKDIIDKLKNLYT